MNDPKESQQEPEQDSGLQTPQPDQPHPPVSDRDQYSTEVTVETDGPAEVNVDVPTAPAE